MGLDFDTDLVEKLTKFTGCNYYSVDSKKEFKKIMSNDFNYTVSPMVLDSEIRIESECFQIESVYGTPHSSETNKDFIRLGSMCASDIDVEYNGTKGGLILIKLKENKDVKDKRLKIVLDIKQ